MYPVFSLCAVAILFVNASFNLCCSVERAWKAENLFIPRLLVFSPDLHEGDALNTSSWVEAAAMFTMRRGSWLLVDIDGLVLLLEYLQKIGFEEEIFVVDLKNLKVYTGKHHNPLRTLLLPPCTVVGRGGSRGITVVLEESVRASLLLNDYLVHYKIQHNFVILALWRKGVANSDCFGWLDHCFEKLSSYH